VAARNLVEGRCRPAPGRLAGRPQQARRGLEAATTSRRSITAARKRCRRLDETDCIQELVGVEHLPGARARLVVQRAVEGGDEDEGVELAPNATV